MEEEDIEAKSLKIVVDDSKADYEARKVKRKNTQKNVTFSEIINVTLFRDISNSFSGMQDNSQIMIDENHVQRNQRLSCLVEVRLTCELLLMFLILGSIFELLSAAEICVSTHSCQNLQIFAIFSGAISLATATAVFIFILYYKLMDLQIFTLIFAMLMLFWLISSLALTISVNSPFIQSATGFFASWFNFWISALLVLNFNQRVQEFAFLKRKLDLIDNGRSRQLFMVCLLFALVIAASATICVETSCTSSGTTIFTIVWGSISFLLYIYLFVQWKEIETKTFKKLSITFAMITTIGAAVAVNFGPFQNGIALLGFFGSTLATIFSWIVVFSDDPRLNL